MPTAPGWRRLAAFAVDYLLLGAYLGLLTGLGLALPQAAGRAVGAPRTRRGRLLGQALGTATLTLPVALLGAGWYAVSLFVGERRTPDDRAARAWVVAA